MSLPTRCYIIILLFAAITKAEHVYIAQSEVGLRDGSSCANARSLAWANTTANWGEGSGKIGPGDTLHLCGTLTSTLWVGGSGLSSKRITILFEPQARFSAPVWNSGAIRCSSRDNIIVDGGADGIIEATDNGTNLQNQSNSRGVMLSNCNGWEIRNVRIHNMYVRLANSSDSNELGNGIYADNSNDLYIHNNTIRAAGTAILIIYRSSSNVRISSNTISLCSNGIALGSGNSGDTHTNVEVSNNDIDGCCPTTGTGWGGKWTGPPGDGRHHSDGIQFWTIGSGYIGGSIRIHGNYIHGNWGDPLQCGGAGCTTGLVFLGGKIDNAEIFNNVLTISDGQLANGHIVLNQPASAKIYSNTIMGATQLGQGIFITGGSTNHDIRNNVISAFATAVNVAGITDTVANSNNNLFFNINQNLQFKYQGVFRLFSDWQGLGFDSNSRCCQLSPFSASSYRPSSSADAVVDAGQDLGPKFNVDKDGVARPTGLAWDIGAYEFTAVKIPTTPTNLTVTVR